MTDFLVDDRIYQVIEDLLGLEFIWVGSEGNKTEGSKSEWHPDHRSYLKGEEPDINYVRIKVMIYLEKLTKDTGAFDLFLVLTGCPFIKSLVSRRKNSSPGHSVWKDKIFPVFLWNLHQVVSSSLINTFGMQSSTVEKAVGLSRLNLRKNLQLGVTLLPFINTRRKT